MKLQEKSLEKRVYRQKLLSDILRDKQLYLMFLPVFIYYAVFLYSPMYGIQIAFKDFSPFKGIWGSEWIGFENFINFFTGPYFWRLLKNTLLINVYGVVFNFTITVVMALLLNEVKNKRIMSGIQTIIYMPHFVSTVVVAGIVISILSPSSGVVNVIISKLGGEKINFLAQPEWFRAIFTSMTGWQGIGYGTIIYTAAICSIDDSLYEAASIDGAGRFKKMWHITLPGIKSVIVLQLIMKMGHMLSVGSDAILLLYQPITYETADVISTYVFRNGIEGGQYSFSTAVGLFNGLVALIMVRTANMISKKVTETSLW